MTKEITQPTISDVELEALIQEKSGLMPATGMGNKEAAKRIKEIQKVLQPIVQEAARALTGSTKVSS